MLELDQTQLLEQATQIATEYVSGINKEDLVGIVFLGAIVRGYYDKYADIDISIIYSNNKEHLINTENYKGFEVQTFQSNINEETNIEWSMSKRWAYSTSKIIYESKNKITELLSKKVPLQSNERINLMITGITLSEWYCNRLLDLWIHRNDLLNAHYMINEGINQYLNALFALNNQLVADYKWRINYAKKLLIKPELFDEQIMELMLFKENTIGDLERRRNAFLIFWKWTLKKIENEVGMKYEDFKDKV